MRRFWMFRGIRFVLWAAVAVAVLALVVMGLWNWLLPPLFGWPQIGFWQAVALLVLSRILFGHFGPRWGGHSHWRHRMMERWQHMTPEEREKFRAGFRGRCGCGPETPGKTDSTAEHP